jgi:heat shock protein HslJ
MKHTLVYLCLISALLLLVACAQTPEPAATTEEESEPAIEGVWTHVEMEIIGGPDEGKISNPQPSLVFITGNYYSSMFVSSGEPRPLFKSQTPTEKEIVEAYNGFIAVAGPYELKGSTLVIRPSVALEPNLMSGGSFELEYQLEGDTLTLIMDPGKIVYTAMEYEPAYTEGRYKLRRLE